MATDKSTEPAETPEPVLEIKTKRPKIRRRRRKTALKRATGATRTRTVRSFPAGTFEEAIVLAEAMQAFAPGQQRVRRLTVFDKIQKSPDSGPSRQLVTNSSRYGLTKGSYKAEFIELTPDGVLATGEDVAPAAKLRARFKLAIAEIEPFRALYERCKGNKLPSKEFLVDALRETEADANSHSECVDTFILNIKFLGLLRTIAGAERLLTLEHALEEIGTVLESKSPTVAAHSSNVTDPESAALRSAITDDGFDAICFYITPIGAADTEQRRHADFFMEYVVAPALKEFNLKLVRADQIGKPGMIGKQVLEHILKSRLVIADLSFHNPNVFYELCLRHATRLPTVQIIRAVEGIPFDIDQYRTIKIDTSDIYSFMPKLQTYASEIANQVRRALDDPDAVDSPISMYYPSVKLTWDQK